MIELTDCRGNKVLIHTKDIREVRGYFDQRYPSIQSVIILYDGKKIECSHPYDVVKNLTIKRVSGSFLDELIEKHTANKKLALVNCKKMKDSDQYPWYDATFNNELLFVHDLEDLKSRSGL